MTTPMTNPVRVRMNKKFAVSRNGIDTFEANTGEEIDLPYEVAAGLVRDSISKWVGKAPTPPIPDEEPPLFPGFEVKSIEGTVLRFSNFWLDKSDRSLMRGEFAALVVENYLNDESLKKISTREYLDRPVTDTVTINLNSLADCLRTSTNPGFRYAQYNSGSHHQGTLYCPTGHFLVLVLSEAKHFDDLLRLPLREAVNSKARGLAAMFLEDLQLFIPKMQAPRRPVPGIEQLNGRLDQ